MLKYDLVVGQVRDRIRVLLLHKETNVIAAGYRVARHALTDAESIRSIMSLRLDILVIRSLARDASCHVERLQALKFIRAFLDVMDGVKQLSVGIVRALVAIAEQSDDKLHKIAIETLAEIFVQYPSRVSAGGGIRVLLQSMVDGPYELSTPLAMAFIQVMDNPANRSLLRYGRDLEVVVSPFTDLQIRGHVNSEKLQNAARILATLLKTWSGLFALSLNSFTCIRYLVQCLSVPITVLRDVMLDLFLSIFCIKPMSWSSSFLAGRRLTTYGRIPALEKEQARQSQESPVEYDRFSRHFIALLLAVFLECDIIDGLILILKEDKDALNTRKAILLLGEILNMTNKIATPNELHSIATLPELFASAMGHNTAASAAVFQIDKISRSLHKGRTILKAIHENESNAAGSPVNKSSNVRVKLGVQIDDQGFKQLIADTQILNTKTYTKWNWDALSELIQGPLLNPRRLEEAIKTTKFMKRLMSFYRPFKYRFSSIKRTKPNQKYVEVGKALFETLLCSNEGVKYLTENKLLRQIAECLAQLDPMSGISSPEPLFSSQRLANTLSYGYFNMLGTLSSDPNGMAMMERWRMFNMIYHLSELEDREDLITSFIAAMDYRLEGHPRIILSKTLTTGSKGSRLFATNHLRTLVSADRQTQKWAVSLLVGQLYDPDMEVCRATVQVLEQFCNNSENLEHLVSLSPSLDHLGDIGAPLLLLFLSTSTGFTHLQDSGYVLTEMDNWVHGMNDIFVFSVEEYLESINAAWLQQISYTSKLPSSGSTYALLNASSNNLGTISSSSAHVDRPLIPPRHFFGELTLTSEGCKLLRSRGHFHTFEQFISEHKNEYRDEELILKLKGCIWAVGYIAANPLGAPFLEESCASQCIYEIFREHPIYSVRGTAFYALGLIASTCEGAEILDELGWQTVRNIYGDPQGVCLPRNLADEMRPQTESLPETPQTPLQTPQLSAMSASEPEDDISDFPAYEGDPVRRKIMTALSNLSNQILANDASRQLVKLEAHYASRFASPDLFQDAIDLMAKYRYKLPVRRFIFELFDSSALLERMARRKREEQRRARLSNDLNDKRTPPVSTVQHV